MTISVENQAKWNITLYFFRREDDRIRECEKTIIIEKA